MDELKETNIKWENPELPGPHNYKKNNTNPNN